MRRGADEDERAVGDESPAVVVEVVDLLGDGASARRREHGPQLVLSSDRLTERAHGRNLIAANS